MVPMLMLVLVSMMMSACTSSSSGDDVPDAGVVVDEAVVTVLVGETASGWRDDVGARARFNGVSGMTVMTDGRVLVADRFNGLLRTIDPTTLQVSTYSGVALEATVVDGSLADARWQAPTGVATDGNGNIYVGDGPCVRRIDAVDETVTTIAGSCSQLGQVDAAVMVDARFGRQLLDLEVTTDALGTRLFVVDRDNNAVRIIELEQDTVTTLADFDVGLFGPSAMVIRDNALLVSNTGRHTILRIDLNDRSVTTYAGSTDVAGSDDGPLDTATLDQPQGLVVVDGDLVVAGFTGSLRRISDDGIVSTLPGNAEGFFANGVSLPDGSAWIGDIGNAIVSITRQGPVVVVGTKDPRGHVDGVGQEARFGICLSVTSDLNGGLYLTDLLHHTIRHVDLATLAVTTIAGVPDVPGNDDGPVAAATLRGPSGVIVGGDGAVYFSELEGCRVRVVENGLVRTIAGGDDCDVVDGTGAEAAFAAPRELVLTDDNTLFVADHLPGDGVIRKVQLSTGVVTTVARGLLFPRGMTLHDGQLWVGDFEGHTVSRVDPNSGEVERLIGVPEQPGSVDGGRLVALLNQPNGMGAGTDYVIMAELGSQQLRRIQTDTLGSRLLFTTLPGSMPGGDALPLSQASILNPLDVWVQPTANGDDWYVFADGAILRISGAE